MARAKLTYVSNPETGKREWHIHYESPGDATLAEHESRHRALVQELVGDLATPDVEVARGERSQAEPQPEEPRRSEGQRQRT